MDLRPGLPAMQHLVLVNVGGSARADQQMRFVESEGLVSESN